jgi:Ca2+-binding RTX toxin-like protein
MRSRRRGGILLKRVLFILTVTAAIAVGAAPVANTQIIIDPGEEEGGSEGCVQLNGDGYDAFYAAFSTQSVPDEIGGGFHPPTFAAGDQLKFVASEPASENRPTGIELQTTGGTVLATAPFPGTIEYTVPTDGQHFYHWRAQTTGAATWEVSCTPADIGPPPTGSCSNSPATVSGTTGTPGDDVIVGTSGNDVITGGGGNDLICAGEGNDRVLGGEGDDRIFGGEGNDNLNGESGNDKVYGEAGNDQVYGASGDDKLFGGAGDDYGNGGTGNDLLHGGLGNDTLEGSNGDDYVAGSNGDDDLDGGVGFDTAEGGVGTDSFDHFEVFIGPGSNGGTG